MNASLDVAAIVLLLHLFCCCELISCSRSYRIGDSLSFLKRISHKGVVTEWSEVHSDYAPRFNTDSVVRLHLQNVENFRVGDDLKLSFSFNDNQFLSGWLMLRSANKLRCSTMDVQFWTDGEYVEKMNIIPHYVTDSPEVSGQPVEIRYRWIELSDKHEDAAFFFVVVFGGFFLLLLLLVVSTEAWSILRISSSSSSSSLSSMALEQEKLKQQRKQRMESTMQTIQERARIKQGQNDVQEEAEIYARTVPRGKLKV